MDWDSLRLQQLVYLDAVARLGHFGRAAEEVGVTQPALSQGLARLERTVGASLFETHGRRRILTPPGRMVARYAATVLAQSVAVAQRIEARRLGRAGPLTVGMIDAAALYLLSDQLARFRHAFPDVDLRLTVEASSQLLRRLEAGSLDVALVVAPAPGFTTTAIVEEELHVYASAAMAMADVDRWVLYPATSHTRAGIDAAFAARDLRVTVEAESGNPAVLAQLARLGVGATVLPEGIAEAGAEPLTRIEHRIAARTLVAAVRPEAPVDPLVERFLAELKRSAR